MQKSLYADADGMTVKTYTMKIITTENDRLKSQRQFFAILKEVGSDKRILFRSKRKLMEALIENSMPLEAT
jgi:hypothetical protein